MVFCGPQLLADMLFPSFSFLTHTGEYDFLEFDPVLKLFLKDPGEVVCTVL